MDRDSFIVKKIDIYTDHANYKLKTPNTSNYKPETLLQKGKK